MRYSFYSLIEASPTRRGFRDTLSLIDLESEAKWSQSNRISKFISWSCRVGLNIFNGSVMQPVIESSKREHRWQHSPETCPGSYHGLTVLFSNPVPAWEELLNILPKTSSLILTTIP